MKKVKLIILFFILKQACHSQYSDWINFYNNYDVRGIVREDNILWVGCEQGGVVKYEINTGNKTFFDKTISAIPQNYVTSITKNIYGNKWMISGYDEGLIELNGTNWTVFNTVTSNISTNSFKGPVVVDDNNNVWLIISTGNLLSEGVVKFDGTNFTSYIGVNHRYQSSCKDHSGNVWFCASSPKISRCDGTMFTDFFPPQIIVPSLNAKSIIADKTGNIWVGFQGYHNPNPPYNYFKGGLAKFDSASWTEYDITTLGSNSDEVILLSCDSLNNIWISTRDNQVYSFDGNTLTNYVVNGDTTVQPSCIYIDSLNNKWIGSYNKGLFLYDNTNWTNINLSHYPLPANYAQDLKVDHTNNIWATVDYQLDSGIVQFDRVNWITYNYASTGIHALNSAWKIAVDKNNRKWFSTFEGLVMFNDTTWTVFDNLNSNIPSDTLGPIAIDSLNNVWFSIPNGMAKFDGLNFMIYNNSNTGLNWTGLVDCISVNGNNVKYIGERGFLYIFNDTLWQSFNYQNSPLPGSAWITNVSFDSNNNAWLGTHFGAGGLYKFDGTNWIKYITSNSGLLSNEVDYVVVDGLEIWIIQDDIIKYDPFNNSWTYLNYKNCGLPSESKLFNNLAFDYFDNLWVTTHYFGIAAYKPGGVILTSTEENTANNFFNNQIKIYPNPAVSNSINISLSSKYDEIICNIIDIKGNNVLKNKIKQQLGNFQISANNFSKGIYFISIYAPDGDLIGNAKWVIQ